MSRQVLLRSPPVRRSQPYTLSDDANATRKGKKFGEVAGGTAAECAAVFCCCPCTVMELLILGLYKVPTGLCKKAWKRRQRHRLMKRNEVLLGPTMSGPTREEIEAELDRVVGRTGLGMDDQDDGSARSVDMENEMWGRFYATGFWRSPSQKDT
ncbi:hypothetical protein COLO4_25368 [Corchorus olitorius]|uniref:Uncharacterized protein n=1 Tax=Corchorus olitorius TaxID=93759 RepID=A0A1R3I398_9ROSI|nr:hypothetical protein COLO4_25368 [Corchorus olitorius]